MATEQDREKVRISAQVLFQQAKEDLESTGEVLPQCWLFWRYEDTEQDSRLGSIPLPGTANVLMDTLSKRNLPDYVRECWATAKEFSLIPIKELIGVVMIGETWYADLKIAEGQSFQTALENATAPSLDPERRECLMLAIFYNDLSEGVRWLFHRKDYKIVFTDQKSTGRVTSIGMRDLFPRD